MSLRHGAEQVSVSLANATSFQLEVRNQQIEALKEAGSSGIHVTLAKKQKRSTLSSNDFRIETLEPLIRSTLQALPLMGEDPFYTLPDPKLQGKAQIDLGFRDPDFEKILPRKKWKNSFFWKRKHSPLILDCKRRRFLIRIQFPIWYMETVTDSWKGAVKPFTVREPPCLQKTRTGKMKDLPKV